MAKPKLARKLRAKATVATSPVGCPAGKLFKLPANAVIIETATPVSRLTNSDLLNRFNGVSKPSGRMMGDSFAQQYY